MGVVGPCGAGKSTLVAALQRRDIRAREIAQEHSYVPALWHRFTRPELLIFLEVSRETSQERIGRKLPDRLWENIIGHLAHARAHADLIVETDPLTPSEVLQEVLRFLAALPERP